jgi:G6PDH family F420-dependent oxidoreductase
MEIGYKLMSEGFGPHEIIRQAVRAEQVGFDFVEMSDHYHPWLEEQGHSSFTWTVLGAVAAKTTRVGLMTGVTCPTMRYHPAVIAQAAATLGIVSDNRFTLGVGAGERLNEHVVGNGFPGVRGRHELLREALDIIRLLWRGDYQSYEGRHLRLEDARVFDLPDELPPIAVAAAGPDAVRIAAEYGDAIMATEPKPALVNEYQDQGGKGPRYAEVPLAWAKTEQEAVDAVLNTTAWAVTGWPVMSELPNPSNFSAASRTVRPDDVRAQFAVGPDTAVHRDMIRKYEEAGFDHLVLMNSGPDPDGFFEFFEKKLRG